MSSPTSSTTRLPERHGRLTTLSGSRPTSWGARRRARVTAVAFWGNLVLQLVIILSGAAVRLTASGLGCSTWPNCEPGAFTPELTMEAGIHPFVEFGNRLVTGPVLVFAVGVALVSLLWLRHKGTGFLVLSFMPLAGTLLQALLGMVVVLADLHPGIVSPHFLISPILVAVAAVLLVHLYDGDGHLRRLAPRRAVVVFVPMAVLGFAILVLGTIVTGTGPHSGDAGDIARITVNPIAITRAHSLSVYAFCALLAVLLLILHRARVRRETLLAAWALVGLTLVQGVIGYIQYFTGLPELVVFFHVIGAALFAAGIAWVGARLVTWQQPGPAAEAAPVAHHTTPHHTTESR